MDNQLTFPIFCANCQTDTPHTGQLDSNADSVFTCTLCGRAIKQAANLSPQEIVDNLAIHKEANIGQVSIEKAEKTLAEVMSILSAPKVDDVAPEAEQETTPEEQVIDTTPTEEVTE